MELIYIKLNQKQLAKEMDSSDFSIESNKNEINMDSFFNRK